MNRPRARQFACGYQRISEAIRRSYIDPGDDNSRRLRFRRQRGDVRAERGPFSRIDMVNPYSLREITVLEGMKTLSRSGGLRIQIRLVPDERSCVWTMRNRRQTLHPRIGVWSSVEESLGRLGLTGEGSSETVSENPRV